MTTTIKEEIAVLKEQGKHNKEEHNAILVEVSKISDKLDNAIDNKADKVALDEINSRFWAQLDELSKRFWAFVLLFASAFVGLLVFLIQNTLSNK